MKPISLVGSSTPFVEGKWYYKKRISRMGDFKGKPIEDYYPQVMKPHLDPHGNVISVIVPGDDKLIVLKRAILREKFVFYEEFDPATTENFKFETGKRYRVANRGIIDSLFNLSLRSYGHNTSLRRFLSHGSKCKRNQNMIYIHSVDCRGNANVILGSDHNSLVQRRFDTKIPGWLLMFLEEVGKDKEAIESDPVETLVSQHESLEDNVRRQAIQDEPVDLPYLVSDEDLELIKAVKFLIKHREIKYGSGAVMRLHADGYTYGIDSPEFLITWAAKRKLELQKYGAEISGKINELKELVDFLPK